MKQVIFKNGNAGYLEKKEKNPKFAVTMDLGVLEIIFP